MQDIRWKAFWSLLFWAMFCLMVGWFSSADTAWLLFSVGALAYLAGHLYWTHRLYQWALKPSLNFMPNGKGIWEDIFANLYHEMRRHSRSQSQLSSSLERLRHATSALPDGVVVLNNRNEIEWFNEPAIQRLGLKRHHDESQPIYYLVRQAEFVQYLQAEDYSEPLKLKSWRSPDITLELQIIPFASKQRLLICRDVSAIEKTEVMRRDFIANVSHELRTPLTVIGGFLETIGDMQGEISPDIQPYFDMMQSQTTRMRRIIEDLLTLSRLENNVTLKDEADIAMPAILNLLLKDAQALSQGQHTVRLHLETEVNIRGSYNELLSALSNLTSNAVRYTPAKGCIDIYWQLRGEEAVFTVQDTGIGIESHHLPRLTERFYRVDSGRSRDTGGTGLGLSIVKHILHHHQASLQIESEPGQGSRFIIVFPAQRVLPA
ncbi:phosphate regulon sensor histidine kinase PhoR [Methylophilus medardicus]|uniref:Phosphate regulon sensor protein PhoR n=1 Tax=Methylophilus medardicus TaxID=2588534 RepID=A0A5B8CU19_9PROT|nr:phosphate regulon sensor histidine kinase PhoR [Methylophilus medardicus]QDC44739.1 phosphate regulon sensor histidine kinase PhoR [Methylophilus medardicus]QDC49746.1 phosphate regulon sensor histidine kinase PhoR [Methylophilus medardicus]QDC53451.1 phosphate regulon sensor histidine kinase PhoR [Methylophilus medardicus]